MKTFADKIANGTACWLDKKRRIGLGKVFGEGVLTFAVAELLVEQGFEVSGERHAHALFGIGNPGEVNYDLESKAGERAIVWELKYLKTPNDQRFAVDLFKLAYPPIEPKYERLFLVAYSGTLKSNLLKKLCDIGDCHFSFSRDDNGVSFSCGGNRGELSGDSLQTVARCLENPSTIKFRVKCMAKAELSSESVIIFAVRRRS